MLTAIDAGGKQCDQLENRRVKFNTRYLIVSKVGVGFPDSKWRCLGQVPLFEQAIYMLISYWPAIISI